MNKKIGEFTLKEIINLCDNKCGECDLWEVCKVLDWNILFLALENQKTKLLDKEIEVEEDENDTKRNKASSIKNI